MIRTTSTLIAAALFAAAAYAQAPAPAPQPAPPSKPKAGTIFDIPGSGRITDSPSAPKPAQTTPRTAPSTAGVSPDMAALAGLPIERFEAKGNTSVASDTIRVYLGVSPGESFDPAALQKNFLNLWQTGLFDDIRLEAEKSDAGVIVRAVVKERPRIGAVEYRGNKELTSAKIGEALDKDKIDIHIGNTVEQTLVRRAAESIKKAYSEGGFEGVTVDANLEDMNTPGEKKVVFTISEGIKAKIAAIDFVGNTHFSDRKLRSQMKEVQPNNLVSWIRKKNLYIPSKLDEDLENIKNFYMDNGYFNVSFGDPQVVTIGKNTNKPAVKLVIPVQEGEVNTFGEVTVTGNTVFTSDQIIGNWPQKKGEIIRRKPIQNRLDAFDEAYRGRGYIYSYVNPEYVKQPGNVIDVHIQVFEGDQFRLGRLEFQGNTTTKDKVLRREIFLEEGQIMDMETFKQSLYKLGQLGYFKVTDNPDFKVNQDSKTVDILVKGNEEGKNDVQFGGGYSEGGGFFLQSQFATRNFLGEGENLSLSFQKGTRTNYYSLSYSDPWFMDTPNSLGISIFNSNTQYPSVSGIEAHSRGGNVVYGYRLHRFDSMSFVYGLAKSRQHYSFTTTPDANGNVPIADVSDFNFTTSQISPSYNFNSLDNPYDTTRGSRLLLQASYAGGPLGGTIHSFTPQLTATRFFKLSRKSSFSINAEAGEIFPLDDNCSNSLAEQVLKKNTLCVPETERFIVGGAYTVRGFKWGTLGPTEVFGGQTRPAYGYKKHVINAEYIFRVNDPLRFVMFADAGMSYGHSEPWDLSKTRYSTGLELRIFLPVFQFPLRFIYAVNVHPQPGDQFEGFQFEIGNTF